MKDKKFNNPIHHFCQLSCGGILHQKNAIVSERCINALLRKYFSGVKDIVGVKHFFNLAHQLQLFVFKNNVHITLLY